VRREQTVPGGGTSWQGHSVVPVHQSDAGTQRHGHRGRGPRSSLRLPAAAVLPLLGAAGPGPNGSQG
jgi:hypothetical protein